MQNNTGRPLAVGLTIVGALARVLPHAPNFAPVGGLSLFAGARMQGWRAYALPLALMAITDPLVGGFSFATPFIYASFLISVLIGARMLRNTQNPLRIGGAVGLSSFQFFVITNFGVWVRFPETYSHTLAGLMSCYMAAIPFYGRTLAADMLYAGALFGLYAWLSRRLPSTGRVVAQSA
jgi:hypothetical protein